MEATDLNENILKEIFRKHILASRSSYLEGFFCKLLQIFFLSITYIFYKSSKKYLLMQPLVLITLLAACKLL